MGSLASRESALTGACDFWCGFFFCLMVTLGRVRLAFLRDLPILLVAVCQPPVADALGSSF